MSTLIKKEFTLTAAPLTYVFLAFAGMTMIPGYPVLVCGFFICLGIFYTFQFAREYNDVLFTALLPVRKRDVVRVRYLFVVCIQLLGVCVCGMLTILRMTALRDAQVYRTNPLMNANPAFAVLCRGLCGGGIGRDIASYSRPDLVKRLRGGGRGASVGAAGGGCSDICCRNTNVHETLGRAL